ncbi:MAG: peptidylprolyl isomerase [Phycisphaerales bacterium]
MLHTRVLFAAVPLMLAQVALAQGDKAQTPAQKPKEQAPAPADKPQDHKDEKPTQPTAEKFVYVKMATSMGDIVIELNNEKAPISTANFLSYMDSGFYTGTCFHRVISDFMVQGGGFTTDMKQKPTNAPIKNEWQNGLKNLRGTVAMARQGDRMPNPKTVNSATSQFFINVKDNNFLDSVQADGGAYAVFGKVVEGMDVVDKIKAVKTGVKSAQALDGAGNAVNTQFGDVPTETVEIKTITRLSKDESAKYAPAEEKKVTTEKNKEGK